MALRRWTGRAIGLDVHRDFCVVAICEDGQLRSGARVPSTPEGLALFAESLMPSDRVVLEVTGSCWEVARILEPHVERVVVVSPDDTGITRARAKNEIQAVLQRRLQGKPPCSDLFGVKGRRWLAGLELPVEERESVDAGIRHIEFLDAEIAAVERLIAQQALNSAGHRAANPDRARPPTGKPTPRKHRTPALDAMKERAS